MLNQIAIRVLEEVHGKKLPSIMEEASGVTAKTWKKGGPRSPAIIERARNNIRSNLLTKLQMQGGLSCDEAVARYRAVDRSDGGFWLNIVRGGLPPDDPRCCPRTEAIARQLDELGNRLGDLRKDDDLVGYREALLDSEFLDQGDEWLRRQFDGTETAILRDAQVTSWDEMNPLVAAVVLVALFRLMASWDVEFHSHYLTDQKTGRGRLPLPLFAQVLPRLRPGSVMTAEGEYPSRGLFHLPLRRLLEFSYCLATYHRTRSWPATRQTSRTHVAAAGGVLLQGPEATEQPLAKIYKGTRGLTGQEFSDIWDSLCGHQREEDSPMAPWPLYFAAQLWTALLVDKAANNKTAGLKSVIVLNKDAYQHWWEASLSEFGARGTRFGKLPWPEYLLNG